MIDSKMYMHWIGLLIGKREVSSLFPHLLLHYLTF